MKKKLTKSFGVGKTLGENTLKQVYKKSKPAMLKKFGRILSYEEFCATLAYAHEKGLDK